MHMAQATCTYSAVQFSGLLENSKSPDSSLATSPHQPASDPGGGAPIALGDVVVSKDDTLDDLRIHILTLDLLENAPVPMPTFLRVRLMEGQHVTTVLRGSTQTLQ